MLCKKCNTAVADGEKVCTNCGAKMQDRKIFVIVSAVLVVLALGAILYFNAGGGGGGNEAVPLPMDDLDAQDETNSEGDNAIEGEEPPQEEEEVHKEPDPLENNVADLNKTTEEVWEMLDAVVISAYEYYEKYAETITYVSKNGYLYEVPSKSYVFVDDIFELTDLEEQYADDGILFFYIKPKDLKEYSGMRVSDSDELKIFAAYETRDGFVITSKNEYGGVIARENLQVVLEKYLWNHGEIRKIPYDSDDFNVIITTLTNYTGNEGGFDIRYMYRDDKYITVVLSPKDNPKSLNQFVLEYNGVIFVVKAGNLETTENYRVAANDALPDFNLDMLPDYSIATYSKHIQDDFFELLLYLQMNEIVTDEDFPVVFQTGTSDFVYFEFTSGRKFLGHLNEGTWNMYPVEDYETTISLMKQLNRRPPYFIVKQY